MKKILFLLFTLCCSVIYVSAQQLKETGRESSKSEFNFSELSNYYKAHPQRLERKETENDEDEPHPVHTGFIDPSLIHYRTNNTSRTVASYSSSSFLPVSIAPVDTFAAVGDNNTSIPPDTHGAVDSMYCMTAVNPNVSIQNRYTHTVISNVSLDQFFISVLPGGGTFDPRVHYDPYTRRWYVIAVSGAQTTSSSILIAISKTNDPTGAWWTYIVPAYAPGDHWLDFPDVGFNKKWIIITGNLFANTGSGYLGNKSFVFNKASLLSGAGAPYTAFTQSSSECIAPAVTYDTTQTDVFAIENYDGSTGKLHMWKYTGPVGSESMSSVGFPATTQFWQSQSNANSGTAGADFAPQSGTANKIQTDDDRITQVVFMNNTLWTSHNIFLPYSTTANATRCSAQWWQIDTTGTPIQIGSIDDPTNAHFYAFPTITPNKNNDAVIGYTTFSPSSHPNASYSIRYSSDPLDSMRPSYNYRHGKGTYFKNFGGSRCRWGDYSSTCLDPINLTDIWTIQETDSSLANTWDTWWAHIQICIPPTTPTAAITPATQCSGSTALYSVNAVSGATSYTWTITGTGWSGASTTDSINITAGTGVGTISVVANSACASSAAYTFTVSPLPVPSLPVVTPPATTPCAGAIGAVYTATSTLATSFLWNVLGTGWSGTSSTNTLNANVGASAGLVIVYGINSCGHGPADTLIVTPSTGPSTPVVSLVGTIPCFGATTINYTATSTGATSFIWSVLGTGFSGSSTTGAISVTLGTGSGTLICKGVNSCGNSLADTTIISTSPLPSSPVISLVGGTPCITSTSTVCNATSTGAISYSWSVSGTGWTGASATSTLTVGIGSGTGTIICTATNTCGSTTDSISVTPSSGIGPASSISSTTAVCAGSTATFITSPITGATSYVWSVSGAGWSGSSTTNIITVTVGSVTATMSVYGENGCGSGPSYTLISVIPTIPSTADFSIAHHTVGVGMGDVVTYTGTASVFGSYSWNFGGGTATPGIGVGPQTVTWTTTGLKTISLSVTDSGCTSAIFTDTVLVLTTTEIQNIYNNENVELFPNPNKGNFSLLFNELPNNQVVVKLTDMEGRIVYNNKIPYMNNNLITINTIDLPNGVYFVSIITDGKVINKKVVISK